MPKRFISKTLQKLGSYCALPTERRDFTCKRKLEKDSENIQKQSGINALHKSSV